MAVAQVNSTLREILNQLEKLNQNLYSLVSAINKRPQ
jgi:hypothetical protein